MSSNFIPSDTIKLDIDSDGAIEFSFVITQNFNEAGIILKQEIMILVSENIQLQLHKALAGSENYAHTSKLMDQISKQDKWYYLTKYSLTSIQGNFITAPRENPLYLPFKYQENNLGRIKITFLLDNLIMVKEFQINEYAN